MRAKLIAGLVLLSLLLNGSSVFAQATGQTDAQQTITRGEMLRILLDARDETKQNVLSVTGHLSKLPLFIDVASDDALAPYSEVAFDIGLTTGFSDRTLRPNDPVPAEEAIALVMREYGRSGQPQDGDTEWFAALVRGALSLNIVPDPQTMMVGQPIAREQFNEILSRMSSVDRDNLASYPAVAQAPSAAVEAVTQETAATAPAPITPPVPIVPPEPVAPPASAPVNTPEPVQEMPLPPAVPVPSDRSILQYASSKNFAITIPSLGIRDLTVSHPTDSQSSTGLLAPLENGVGHLYSYPGRGGKIMIYGHSSGYSWDPSKYTKIFTKVNALKPGDPVYVTFNGTLYEYAVTGQQTITPTDSTPFNGAGEELILYTCWPPNSIKQRLIVRASPVTTVALR